MNQPSTRPYLIRAIYEWCCECGYTPILLVRIDSENKYNLPKENIKDGEIIFNVNPNAVRNLEIGNDIIRFSARFNGIAKEIAFPPEIVCGVFAREINQGIAFPEVSMAKENLDNSDESINKQENKNESRKKNNVGLRLIK